MRVDPSQRNAIEPGSCPGGPAPDLPFEALITGPPPEVRWSLANDVLRIEHPGTGMSLTAAREESLHEPLPADLETPHDLYGEWAFTRWRDDTGEHEVRPPEGVAVTARFFESPLGPYLGYSDGDCNGSGVEVAYEGDRIDLRERGPSTLMGCPDAWRLEELNRLFAVPGEVRWTVDGETLSLRNEATDITFTAVRIDDR
jgi:hypothetical protein